MARNARILIAYTGGTIGMKKSRHGWRPEPGYLQELMAGIPAFRASGIPSYRIHQFETLLDSSDMTPVDWVGIARAIAGNYAAYDGFLILHGTDTMAYTASALSFMLENLAKPVILTGSQIPLAEPRNDALGNLLTSLLILGSHYHRLPGVYLYFDTNLFRGNRVTKVSAGGFDAFASPNLAPVGQAGVNIEINWGLVPKPAGRRANLRVIDMGDATVAAFRLFPGLKAEYVTAMLAPPVQGVVLECYGSGTGPARNRAFLDALAGATKRGVVIVDVTQTMKGSADLELYANGRALQDAGVISGFDMTAEAALAKLFYLFRKGYQTAEVRRLMQEDLRGELTRKR